MDDVRGALAANLAELRKEENLTQAEFAAQFNYSDKAVSKWERGDSLPDVVMLKTIADLYGLRVDDLLTDGGVAAARAAAAGTGGKQHDAYLMPKVLIAAMWVTMVLVFRHTRRYSEHRDCYAQARVERASLRELTHLGLPVMMQMGMESASFSLSAFYIGWLGSTELAAHQIVITISQLCFMLFYGMAAAVAIAVSYFRGKDRIADSRNVAFAGLHLTWIMGTVLAIPIFLLRHHLGAWFTHDAEVCMMVSSLVIPLCIYQYSDAMQCVFANALRGMADVKPMVWIAFFAYFIVSLPLGYLFSFPCHWGGSLYDALSEEQQIVSRHAYHRAHTY